MYGVVVLVVLWDIIYVTVDGSGGVQHSGGHVVCMYHFVWSGCD